MDLQFINFNKITYNDINFDFHIHTDQTDGQDSIESIIKKAVDVGLDKIAFTEHVRKDTDWFDKFVYSVKETASHYTAIEVLVGIETKVVDKFGNLDVSDQILYRSEIVLGSVHRLPDEKGGYIDFSTLSPKSLAEIEFEFSVAMLQKSPIDVLSHPGGMYSSRYGGFPIEYFKELMKFSKTNNKAIELNSRYIRNVHGFLSACGDIDALISLGSDAHKAENVGNCTKLLSQFKFEKFQKRNV